MIPRTILTPELRPHWLSTNDKKDGVPRRVRSKKGKRLANPIATIASFGMALRYSFDMGKEADLVDTAIAAVLDKGLRTGDIMQPGMTKVGTSDMGKAIVEELARAEV